jgi:hypothetical protein
MKVYSAKARTVNLPASSFLARGGEASVHLHGGKVYKLYHDPKKVIPEAKIRELRRASHPALVVPEDQVFGDNGKPLGIVLPFVKDAVALCQWYPRAYRERAGIDAALCIRLVEALAEAVQAAHRAQVILVDLNEMNVLVNAKPPAVHVIDLDSAMTPSFPPTAQLPAVTDPRTTGFSEATDWFAFAVITFPLFSGIHPYRGKHPTLGTLEARMKAEVSVFHPDVRVPPTASLDAIPTVLRGWYEATFDRGERSPPPLGAAARPVLPRAPVSGIQRSLLWRAKDPIRTAVVRRARILAWTDAGIELDGRVTAIPDAVTVVLGFSARRNRPAALLQSAHGEVTLLDVERTLFVPLGVAVDAMTTASDGRLLVRSHDQILEVDLVDGGTLVPVLLPVAQVLPHATVLGPGAALQDLLGASWLSIFPETGMHRQVRLPELDGCPVLSLQASGTTAVGVVWKRGRYDRFVVRLPQAGDGYDLRWIEDVGSPDLAMVVLASGVVACFDGRGILELSLAAPTDGRFREVSGIADLRLVAAEGRVAALEGTTLSTLSVT